MGKRKKIIIKWWAVINKDKCSALRLSRCNMYPLELSVCDHVKTSYFLRYFVVHL